MNYIDIAFIAVTVLMVIVSAHRGLIVSVFSTLKYLMGIPLSYFLSGLLYQKIYDSFVKDMVYESVFKRLSESKSSGNLLVSIREMMEGIPDYLAENVDLSKLSGLTVEQISRNITDSVLEPIILTILKIIIFIVIFIIFCIIVSILISVFAKLQKKKHMPLKHTNRLLGGVFGLLKAGMFIFTAATIIGFICDVVPQDSSFAAQADSSFVLECMNTNNPLFK